jgi:hypothetical protein
MPFECDVMIDGDKDVAKRKRGGFGHAPSLRNAYAKLNIPAMRRMMRRGTFDPPTRG